MAEQTEQISVRVNPPLLTFLKRWAAATTPAMKPATVARYAAEIFKDLTEELGNDWLEIVRKAGAAGQEPGAYIGAMIKAALDAERKARR